MFTADTIDDLIYDVFEALLDEPFDVSPTRGRSSELLGVMLHLNNPLARLSRTETRGKPFSALGELMWYLAKSNKLDFIKHYIRGYEKESPDRTPIHGA